MKWIQRGFSYLTSRKPYVYGLGYLTLIPAYALMYAYGPAQILVFGKHTPGLLSSFYVSAITITTLGYGDITPIGSIGQMLTASESILGIVFIGLFLNSLSHQHEAELKARERAPIKAVIDAKVSLIVSSSLLVHMAQGAGVSVEGIISDENIKTIFGRINPNDASHAMLIGAGGKRATWLEVMLHDRNQSKKSTKELMELATYLDPELVKLLNDIEACTYYMVLDGVASGLPFGNTNLLALEPEYRIYQSHIGALRRYRERLMGEA